MGNLYDADWLENYRKKRTLQGLKPGPKKSRTTRAEVENELIRHQTSPHYLALQYLARHPDDQKGKQEYYAQVRVMWHLECHEPEIYKRTHSTPNGGLRHEATAGRMKAEGQKKGYPDLSYDKPRGIYCGMRIELKYGRNKPSPEQIAFLNQLSDDGYYCVLCYGDKEAIDAILHYDRLDDFGEMPAHINDPLWKKKAA